MLSPRCFDGVWYVQWSVIRSCLVLQVVGSWGRSQGYNGCIVACQPLVVYCSCMSLGVISSHFFMSRHVTHCLRALSSAGDHWLLRNPPIGWPTSPRRTRTCSIHGGLIYIYIYRFQLFISVVTDQFNGHLNSSNWLGGRTAFPMLEAARRRPILY